MAWRRLNSAWLRLRRAAYSQAQSGHPERVLLNFAGVNYINSPGIGLIISLLAEARQAGQTVMACGLSAYYERIFVIIGLTELMPILSDEAQPGQAGGLPEFHPEFEPVVPQAQ